MSVFDYTVVDGKLVPFSQAQISIFDKAFWASYGVYESVKVDRGCPFYLEDHLQRLLKSAEVLELGLKIDIETLVGWFEQLRVIEPEATWSLKIVALGTVEKNRKPVIAMQADVLPTYLEVFYHEGAAAILYGGQRALPMCKSLNTLVNHLARRAANRVGAVEGLLYHNGYLTEGARSNLFAVRQGQLVTPPSTEVLSGITRDITIQMMQSTDFPVVETPMPIDLALYEEFFITSTSMHVLPITKIDDRPIGNGRVGPVTQLAIKLFEVHYNEVMCLEPSRP